MCISLRIYQRTCASLRSYERACASLRMFIPSLTCTSFSSQSVLSRKRCVTSAPNTTVDGPRRAIHMANKHGKLPNGHYLGASLWDVRRCPAIGSQFLVCTSLATTCLVRCKATPRQLRINHRSTSAVVKASSAAMSHESKTLRGLSKVHSVRYKC